MHPVGDLDLTTYCIEHGWEAADTCWIAGLMMQPDVSAQARSADWDDRWYFPIADLGFPLVLLRADEMPAFNGQRRFFPYLCDADRDSFVVTCAHDFGLWYAMPYRWCPPIEDMYYRNVSPMKAEVGGEQTDHESPFLQCAAKHAFWQMTKAQLMRVADNQGVPIGDSSCLFSFIGQALPRG